MDGSGDPANGMVIKGDPGFPDNFQDPVGLLVEPRVGVAYDVFGDGRTAMRANFGVFHNATQAGALSWRQALNPPANFRPQIFYGQMSTLLQTQGITFPTATTYGAQIDNPAPTMYNFQVGVQHELGWQTVIDLAYVHTEGKNLPQIRNINTVPFGARFLPENQDPTRPGSALPDNFFRPFPGYGNILEVLNAGPSEYNAMQLALNRRYSGGFEFTVAYTLSEASDYTSADILYGNRSRIPFYQDPDVFSYGLADFDRTHNLVFSYNWDLPEPAGSGIKSAVLGGWHLAGISTFTSGTPVGIGFTTTDNADILGGGDQMRRMIRVDGIGAVGLTDRPIVTGDPNSGPRTIDQWFNTSVFSRPGQGEVGNARKDDMRLPGVSDTGIRISKRMQLGAGQTLEVGVEMYNLFNEVSFLDVDTTAQFDADGNQVDPRFGAVISSRTPFTALFTARYRF